MFIRLLASIFLITLISCGENSRPVSNSVKDQILYLGNGTEPQGLDPHLVTGVPEHKILMSIMEGLVIEHPEGKGVLPGVAKSWDVSSDGKQYLFRINPKARWSNGDKVVANDFVYAWKRLLTPSLGAQYADMLYIVKNAELYNKGSIKDFSRVGIKALDDSLLEVKLNNPTPYFLHSLKHYSTWPVHQKTIETFGEFDSRISRWTLPGNFVGNGPFVLKSWELNRVLIVEKNSLYWNADKVTLKEIHFFPTDSESREDLMYRAGQLHLMSTVPQEKISEYKQQFPEQLKIDNYFGTYFYRINTNEEHLSDKRVRKALSLSIDRKEIVENVTKGGQVPAYSFSPPDKSNFYPSTNLDFNPQKARTLLTEAGYPEGKGLPKIEILYNTNEGHQKIAQAIQQMWKINLNIDVELVNADWQVYLDRERNGDFFISRAGWIGDYPDANSFLDMMVTGRGNNKTGWSNTKYDYLITTLRLHLAAGTLTPENLLEINNLLG